MPSQPKPFNAFSPLLLVFFLLAIGIGATGYAYYEHERDRIRRATHDDLSAIADLKVNQIEGWRKERLMDADVIMKTPLIPEAVNQWLKSPAQPKLEQTILTWMKANSSTLGFTSTFLLDSKGVTRLTISKHDEQLGGDSQRLVAEVLRSGKAILSDLYRVENGTDIRIDLCVPLLPQSGRDMVPVGALLLRTDPFQFLYPLIQSWPTPSPTSETLLVRREGDEILFLNDLRHQHNTALTLRLSVKEEKLPASMAARGVEGVVEGVDYRGVPVLAALRKIPDSPWFLIAKVDIEEIYAPIRRRFWMAMIVTVSLIVTAGVAIGLLRRQELVMFYRKAHGESEQLVRERTAELTAANSLLESEIVEHRRTEEALNRERGKLRAILDTMNDGVYIVNRDHDVQYINPVLEREFGPVNGRKCHEVLHGFQEPCPWCSNEDVSAGKAVHSEWYSSRTGKTYELFDTPIINEDGSLAKLKICHDITERTHAERARRAAEDALEQQRVLHVRSDRLRSLGEMAAGIAHELNQPLVGVRGLAEHLLVAMNRGWSLTEKGAREKLNLIVEQADRMVHIIDHVRMFAREAGNPQLKAVQVNDVIRSATDMLRAQFKSRGVEMECDLMETLPPVSANPFSLEEVVLNLMVNARDATVDRLRGDPVADARVLLRTSLDRNASGQQVKIEVVDRGTGIHEDVLPRVFDPFFTTKALEKGTGLGLSISKAIVEQFGGTIDIESSLNQGTTVTIRLPVEEKGGEGER